MGKSMTYEELLQYENSLYKHQDKIAEQEEALRVEHKKIQTRINVVKRKKLKFYTEAFNKCFSGINFRIVKVEHLYSDRGLASFEYNGSKCSHCVWFYCMNGCKLDDIIKENVQIDLLKNELNEFEINIYPLEIGGKCLATV